MGMAASQVNLLKLTARKNSIQGQLTDLSFQKIRLTSDVNKITKEYTDAINAKTLKWSNNGGTSYIDLTYKNLMNPNSQLSNNNTNLITDSSGRVVLHDDYKKYADKHSNLIYITHAACKNETDNLIELLKEINPKAAHIWIAL